LFVNNSGSLVRYYPNLGTPDPVPVPAGEAYVEFLWAPLETTAYAQFQPLGAPVLIGPVAGRFFDGARTISAGSGFAGISPGATVAAVIRGWMISAGATFAEASSQGWGLFGYSSIFQVDTGDPTTIPPETAAAITSGSSPFSGLTLLYIPEPSSAALCGFGVVALLLARRRTNDK